MPDESPSQPRTEGAEEAPRRKLGRSLALVFGNVVLVAVLFLLIEGAASTLFVAHEIVTTPVVPEHKHAEHDTLLGWANLPDVHLADYYGPGIDVVTNAQGFRNDRDFTAAVPDGKVRAICSGDSFTFGYGVANDDVWCEVLTELDPRLETVNMGLGGYGVDQAWLWYVRDGLRLEHDVQLFAFLVADFDRMRSDRFMGYGKPFLEFVDDSVVVANTPVPRTSWWSRRRALHSGTIFRLAIVRLLNRLLGSNEVSEAESQRAEEEDRRLRAIISSIFDDLQRRHEAAGSRLVLVFFPGVWDYQEAGPGLERWRTFVREEAERLGVPLIDMIEELRQVPPQEVRALYAPNSHFSVAGNRWAAEVLHRRLAPILDGLGN